MKTILYKPIIIFFIFFLNFSLAIAQSTLNKDEIEKYLVTIPQIHQLAATYQKNHEEEEKEQALPTEPSSFSQTPITDSLSNIREHPTFEEFLKIITRAGFQSPEQWANTGDRIMMAYSAFKLKNPPNAIAPGTDELKNNLQDQLQNIEKNQFLRR